VLAAGGGRARGVGGAAAVVVPDGSLVLAAGAGTAAGAAAGAAACSLGAATGAACGSVFASCDFCLPGTFAIGVLTLGPFGAPAGIVIDAGDRDGAAIGSMRMCGPSYSKVVLTLRGGASQQQRGDS